MWTISEPRWLSGPNVWFERPAVVLRCVLAEVSDGNAENIRPREDETNDHLIQLEIQGKPHAELIRMAKRILRTQIDAGCRVRRGHIVSEVMTGTWTVAVEIEEREFAAEVVECWRRLIDSPEDPGDAARGRLSRLWEQVRLETRTADLARSAAQRGIPCRRFASDSLILLGQGVRQRRISLATTDRTGYIGERVSCDKVLTKSLLESIGTPVPPGVVVSTAEEAWSQACQLGLPVVVKPRDADYGNGVSLHLETRPGIEIAFHAARKYGTDVVVERHIPGITHRLLVVGDRLVAAVRRMPAHVVGDGTHSIRELVEIENRNPRRGDQAWHGLCPIQIGPVETEVLAAHGLHAGCVPPRGTWVRLRRDALTGRGGSNEDVTPCVHPETTQIAVDAARFIGLDIAGIDLVADDISRPLREQGGAILEINAQPALYLHQEPTCDRPQPVIEAILDSVFPGDSDGRVGTIAVVGSQPAAQVARVIAELLHADGHAVGLATSERLSVAGQPLARRAATWHERATAVLLHPRTELAVIQFDVGDVLREGLAMDCADVTILVDADDEFPARSRTCEEFSADRGTTAESTAPPLSSYESLTRACELLIARTKTQVLASAPFLTKHAPCLRCHPAAGEPAERLAAAAVAALENVVLAATAGEPLGGVPV